ncbi:MAG: hypothetical protein QOJ96_2197 [Alphaproteobacteria bacterium]|jgi:hypothetical protein|nr:hypothetical protein [Alphaproteobacteria bacterium]
MDFRSASPSIVRPVRQRDLLNAWLRAFDTCGPLPRLEDYRPDRIADELADMMGFDVIGKGERARFLITQEGSRSVINAVIDRNAAVPSRVTAADDLVELD